MPRWEIFTPLNAGASLTLARPDTHRDPRYLAELMIEEHITTLMLVPTPLRALLTASRHQMG